MWFNWTSNELTAKSSWKYTPLLAHYFEVKVGRGICPNIQLILWMTPSPHLVPHNVMCDVDIHNNCCKNSSFTGRVLQEISSGCVDTKPKGIEESCIISGDGMTTRVFTNILTMELNQKLTKTCLRRCLGDHCYGSKRGKAFAQKWHIFKSYGTMLCFLVVT